MRDRALAAYEQELSRIRDYEELLRAARERQIQRAFELGLAEHWYQEATQDSSC